MLVCLLGVAVKAQQCPGRPPSPSGAADRFPSVARCLGRREPNTSCISCRTVVTVDAERGSDCARGQGSLSGRVCTELEDVIESIASQETCHPMGSCIQVLIRPRSGRRAYDVMAREGRVIQQSVVLTGTSEVCMFYLLRSSWFARMAAQQLVFVCTSTHCGLQEAPEVRFVPDEGGEGDVMVYAFRLSNQLTAISNLEFQESPGAIGLDNVDVVAIENSSFR